MKKKSLLLFAPLAVFALALPSCGKNNATKYKLDRHTYTHHSDSTGYNNTESKCTGFAKVANKAYSSQFKSSSVNDLSEIKSYNLGEQLKKATVTTKAEIHVDGEGTIYVDDDGETTVIDLSSLGGTIGDIVKTEWDVDGGYLKSTDSLGGFNYIQKEGTGETAKFWRCFGTEIKGKKYRYEITDYVNKVGGFENAVVIEQAMNSGMREGTSEENLIAYEGLDISSFGGNTTIVYSGNESPSVGYINNLDIGTFLLGKGDLMDMPGLQLIELVSAAIAYLKLPIDNFIDCSYDGNKDGSSATKASLDVGLKNENLSIINDIFERIEETGVQLPFEIPVSKGKGTLNYFVNYENNFVRQQEILINIKNTDFVLRPAEEHPTIVPIAIDLKGVDLTAVINEDVKANTCNKDTVKLDDYVVVPRPTPGF